MTYKATYYVGDEPKETRYYRSVIEAALYFEKHPGEFDGMSAALQRAQDMRQGKWRYCPTCGAEMDGGVADADSTS